MACALAKVSSVIRSTAWNRVSASSSARK
jgi:hypothetical protein